jgi:tRNA (cytidine/uridine-2'-O-)-methyltransferase
MKIALINPQIPQNTGNIVRSCSVTATNLILVTPLGFSTDSRMLKRAGLDYWEGVDVKEMNMEEFQKTLESQEKGSFYFFSSHASASYSSITFSEHDILIFGSETSGLPDSLFKRWPQHFHTIPMTENKRCLNLATSAGIVLYEAWRQNNFSF